MDQNLIITENEHSAAQIVFGFGLNGVIIVDFDLAFELNALTVHIILVDILCSRFVAHYWLCLFLGSFFHLGLRFVGKIRLTGAAA